MTLLCSTAADTEFCLSAWTVKTLWIVVQAGEGVHRFSFIMKLGQDKLNHGVQSQYKRSMGNTGYIVFLPLPSLQPNEKHVQLMNKHLKKHFVIHKAANWCRW